MTETWEARPHSNHGHPEHRREKRAMIVAQRIVSDVRRQGLEPGDKLPSETAMLKTYAIGRGTLREALRLLEFEGAVSLKPGPGGGPVLQRPTADHLATTLILLMQLSNAPFRVVVEARRALEPMISNLAARQLTPDVLERLQQSVVEMEAHITDREAYFELNKEFHGIIAWSSGNALFGYWVDSLVDIMDGTRVGIEYAPQDRMAIVAAHQSIVVALGHHDPVEAEDAMREHVEAYARYAEHKYPEVLEKVVTWEPRR